MHLFFPISFEVLSRPFLEEGHLERKIRRRFVTEDVILLTSQGSQCRHYGTEGDKTLCGPMGFEV
jgi:hypothetical protein